MTFDQWLAIEAVMATNWANSKRWSETEVAIRHRTADPEGEFAPNGEWIGSLDHSIVERVVICMTDREFPPTPGQIRAAVASGERPPAPAPGTVIALLKQAAGKFGASPYMPAEKQRQNEADAIRWLADRSPHAARFAVEHGWRQFCREGLDDPEFGGAVRQRLERSITGSVAGLEREYREGRVLSLVGDHVQRLEAGGDTPSGLRRIGGVGALGLVPPKELDEDNDRKAA